MGNGAEKATGVVTVSASQQCGQGSILAACNMWFEFAVVDSLLAPVYLPLISFSYY